MTEHELDKLLQEYGGAVQMCIRDRLGAVRPQQLDAGLHIIPRVSPRRAAVALANDADRQWLNAYLVNVKAAVRVGCGFLIRQIGVEPWTALQRDGLLDGQRQCGGCIGQRDFHTCMGTVIAQTADIQGALREVGVGKRNIHKAGKCIRLAGLVALRPRADGVAVARANVCIVHTEQGCLLYTSQQRRLRR